MDNGHEDFMDEQDAHDVKDKGKGKARKKGKERDMGEGSSKAAATPHKVCN